MLALALVATLLVASAIAEPRGVTTRESLRSDDPAGQADAPSYGSAISVDGRYVAFTSAARLAANDTNDVDDVYRRDRLTGTTVLVTVHCADELCPASGNSGAPAISADGRHVAFDSDAEDLVLAPDTPPDSNAASSVFVRDVDHGSTTLVSVSSEGTQTAGIGSFDPAISADGRYVAFRTDAQLAPPALGGIDSLFVPFGISGVLTAALTVGAALLQVSPPAPVDNDSDTDYYRHDRDTGDTVLLSPRTCEEDTCVSAFDRDPPAISADGNLVAFSSGAPDREVVDPATGLPTSDANGSVRDIFLRDVAAGTTTIVSRNDAGQQGDDDSSEPTVSADAGRIAFTSAADNFVPTAETATSQVFVRDQTLGTVLRASQNDGGMAGNLGSHLPSMSPDSRYVSFASEASNLVPSDTNSTCTPLDDADCPDDVFVHNLVTRRTTRVSVNSAGEQAALSDAEFGPDSTGPSASRDALQVAFDSEADNLVFDDTNHVRDVFVRDCSAETTTLSNGDPNIDEGAVSVAVDGLGAFGSQVPTASNALFNPPGPAFGAAGTVYESFVYLQLVDQFLVECATADAQVVSSSPTSLVTSAVVGTFDLQLTQQLADVDAGGSTLVQSYRLRNPGPVPAPLTLVRYIDADLLFDGTIQDGGGALADGSTLFEFDSSDDPTAPSTFVGVSGQVAKDAVPARWTLQDFAAGGQRQAILDSDGIPPGQHEQVVGDNDGDLIVDAPYDVTLNQQWDGSVPPGATVTFTTVTRFGFKPPIAVPAITLNPLNFGPQRVAAISDPQTVSVRNVGDGSARITSATVSGDHPGDFPVGANSCDGVTLEPGQSCSMTIRFQPTAEGERRATVVVTDDAPGSPHTATIVGIGVQPRLVIDPDPLDFGEQRVGTTSDERTATVSNVGSGPTEILGVALAEDSPFDLVGEDCTGLTLEPGDECVLRFTFSPTRPGPRPDQYAVDDDTDAPPPAGGLVGVGVESRIVIRPDPIDFNGQRVDTVSDDRTVTVTNIGSAPTPGDGIAVTVEGPRADEFHLNVDDCSNQILDPDESCTVAVAFAPEARGPRSAQLVVSELMSGDADPVASADLLGEGLEPDIVIRPDPVDFGEQQVGRASRPRTVVIANVGDFDAFVGREIRGAQTDEFAFVDDACSRQVIEPGDECELRLRFTPEAPGRRVARLVVFNHGANPRGNVDLAQAVLRGVGTDRGAPALAVDPNPIDFGPQVVGTVSAVRLAAVTNVGGAPLTIATVTLETPVAGEHVINAEGCSGAALAPGESCLVALRFTPTAGGLRGGALVLIDDAADSPQRVLVVGLGLVPRLQVDPPLGRPGFVATVSGAEFPANTEVALTWNPGLGGTRVVTGPDGTFRTSLLVFRRDILGPRLVEARFGAPPGPAVTAEYLVVPGTYEPPGFVVRG